MIDRRAALGLMAGAGATLSGCGRNDGITRLRFWAMGNEATNVPQILPAFEAANPGIKVAVQAVPWTGAHQKLLTAYAGASLPDVSQIGNTWVAELAAIGALSPTPEAAADLLTDQFPAVLETNEIAGRAMTTPWYVDTRLLFYRKDLLARAGFGAPPENWAEWKRAMHAVKRVAGDGNFAILLPVNEFEQLLTFGLQGDQPLLRDVHFDAVHPAQSGGARVECRFDHLQLRQREAALRVAILAGETDSERRHGDPWSVGADGLVTARQRRRFDRLARQCQCQCQAIFSGCLNSRQIRSTSRTLSGSLVSLQNGPCADT